ncbi:MAG: SUMF1/EgtB/PvdO family nonheme iron enzyme [Syntrophobacter sp.]
MTVRNGRAVEWFLRILLAVSISGVMLPAAVDASQDEAKRLYQIGNDLFEKGKFREAARKYEEAIEIVNDFAPLYYNLAEAQVELKEYENAIKNYREYLRLRPDGNAARKAKTSINKLEGILAKTAQPSVSQPSPPPRQESVTPPPPQPSTPQAAAPTPGQVWRDPIAGLEFVWVPAGCFDMGSPGNEYGRLLWESPRHKVCLDGFWMGKYEVTQGQWEKIMGGSASIFSRKGENYPVDMVSWNDAKKFAQKLEERGGKKDKFRLPTEAEWEYACRAGTRTIYYWGEKDKDACLYENLMDEDGKRLHDSDRSFPCKDGYAESAPVGQFKPNKFGLHDMLGNVTEWCEDTFSPIAYMKHSPRNPIDKNPVPFRVIRGSDWRSDDNYARCAKRGSSEQNLMSPTRGFRIVREPLQP